MFRTLLQAAMGSEAPEVSQEEVNAIELEQKQQKQRDQDEMDEDDDDQPQDDEEDAPTELPATQLECVDISDADEMLFGAKRAALSKARRKRKEITGKAKPPVKKKKRIRKLPPDLSRLLGDANMSFSAGEYEKAIGYLKDSIRLAPTIPDPYHTLGMIYENMQEKTKALQYYMIAAALTPDDAELWTRIGQMAWEQGELEESLNCFTRASRIDRTDSSLLANRAELLIKLQQHAPAGRMFLKWSQLEPSNLNILLRAAESFFQGKRVDRAIEALVNCTNSAFESTSPEHQEIGTHAVNMLADLYIGEKKYKAGVKIIQKYHSVLKRAAAASTESSASTTGGHLNESQISLPLDIAVKYGICHVHLGDFSTAETMFRHLQAQDLHEYGDLFLDVADAYGSNESKIDAALALYMRVIRLDEYNTPEIWHKIGICHEKLHEYKNALVFYEKAIDSFRRVATQPTNHKLVLDALRVCNLTNEIKKGIVLFDALMYDDVLNAPVPRRKKKSEDNPVNGGDAQDTPDDGANESIEAEEGLVDLKTRISAVAQYCLLKNADKEYASFCELGMPLMLVSLQQADQKLTKNNRSLEMPEEIVPLGLEKLRNIYLPDIDDPAQANTPVGILTQLALEIVVAKALGEETISTLLTQLSQALIPFVGPVPAIELIASLLNFRKIKDRAKRLELRFVALVIALESRNMKVAYECALLNIREEPDHVGLWNMFNHIVSISGSIKLHQKNLGKLLEAHSDNVGCMALSGNYCLSTEIKLAISELSMAYGCNPDDPIVALSMGAGLTNLVMSRKTIDRQQCVSNSFAFLCRYRELRECLRGENDSEALAPGILQAETNYNFARAFHHLGLTHLAISLYEQVLKYYDTAEVEFDPALDLRGETAYNLSLIYRASGSNALAQHLLMKYNSI